jgi:hypothetical protein
VGSGARFGASPERCLQVREREGAVRERGGASTVRHLAGSAIKEARARFRRSGARVGARFGDAPARSAVRSSDHGGMVRQPYVQQKMGY